MLQTNTGTKITRTNLLFGFDELKLKALIVLLCCLPPEELKCYIWDGLCTLRVPNSSLATVRHHYLPVPACVPNPDLHISGSRIRIHGIIFYGFGSRKGWEIPRSSLYLICRTVKKLQNFSHNQQVALYPEIPDTILEKLLSSTSKLKNTGKGDLKLVVRIRRFLGLLNLAPDLSIKKQKNL